MKLNLSLENNNDKTDLPFCMVTYTNRVGQSEGVSTVSWSFCSLEMLTAEKQTNQNLPFLVIVLYGHKGSRTYMYRWFCKQFIPNKIIYIRTKGRKEERGGEGGRKGGRGTLYLTIDTLGFLLPLIANR